MLQLEVSLGKAIALGRRGQVNCNNTYAQKSNASRKVQSFKKYFRFRLIPNLQYMIWDNILKGFAKEDPIIPSRL